MKCRTCARLQLTWWRTRLPKGEYFIGDPCYCFDYTTWMRLLTETNYLQGAQVPLFKNNDEERHLVAFDTAYGDGVYEDEDGNEYPVDSGMLGAVPVELIDADKLKSLRHDASMGRFIDYRTEFTCVRDRGNMSFGNRIKIDTVSE